jgi:hypothetical protein
MKVLAVLGFLVLAALALYMGALLGGLLFLKLMGIL